jgi:hypothetical protein
MSLPHNSEGPQACVIALPLPAGRSAQERANSLRAAADRMEAVADSLPGRHAFQLGRLAARYAALAEAKQREAR